MLSLCCPGKTRSTIGRRAQRVRLMPVTRTWNHGTPSGMDGDQHLAPRQVDRLFWTGLWDEGQCSWHSDQVNRNLQSFFGRLVASSDDHIRILIPLCGKTLDLAWLYQMGHFVVGVEYCSKAIESFFSENNIGFEKETLEHNGEQVDIYSTPDKRLMIVKCDFFKFTPDLVGGKLDAVWDRGSLVAINVTDREAYSNLLKDLLVPGGKILAEVLEYDVTQRQGPPQAVFRASIDTHFGSKFSIEELVREVGSELTRVAYLMTSLT